MDMRPSFYHYNVGLNMCLVLKNMCLVFNKRVIVLLQNLNQYFKSLIADIYLVLHILRLDFSFTFYFLILTQEVLVKTMDAPRSDPDIVKICFQPEGP